MTQPAEDEIIVCPHELSGWRVELPHPEENGRRIAAIVATKIEAIKLAGEMRPDLKVRIVEGSDDRQDAGPLP